MRAKLRTQEYGYKEQVPRQKNKIKKKCRRRKRTRRRNKKKSQQIKKKKKKQRKSRKTTSSLPSLVVLPWNDKLN